MELATKFYRFFTEYVLLLPLLYRLCCNSSSSGSCDLCRLITYFKEAKMFISQSLENAPLFFTFVVFFILFFSKKIPHLLMSITVPIMLIKIICLFENISNSSCSVLTWNHLSPYLLCYLFDTHYIDLHIDRYMIKAKCPR